VQKVMLSTNLRMVPEALDLLKRVEILKSHKFPRKAETSTYNSNSNPRTGPNFPRGNDRNRGQYYSRNVQYYRQNARNNSYCGQHRANSPPHRDDERRN
jgi:hypothetical protein